jgi:valyl-tRNA synthetase
LKKEIEGLEKAVASKEKQLRNETFRSRAPEAIIQSMETTLAEQQTELDKLRNRLRQLDQAA